MSQRIFTECLHGYACSAENSRGRLYSQAESPGRSAFQRDRDRIVHSTAFRRLTHKTQVFIYHEGDHYRTRLTHTMEVAQVARAIARMLGVDEDLTEALSLAHDLGHPPFGHAGENALNSVMLDYGGFDHNDQSLRIVTRLERRYAEFDGINLTWECLEGLVKHNGPLLLESGVPTERYSKSGVPHTIASYAKIQDLELWSFPSLEAQIAAISDEVAYNAHDLDDGLRAGFLNLHAMNEVPLFGSCLAEVDTLYPDLDDARRVSETLRRLITCMVNDLVQETRSRLAESKPCSSEDIRYANQPMVAFSEEMNRQEKALKSYLMENVYRHRRVTETMDVASQVLRDIFAKYMEDPRNLSDVGYDLNSSHGKTEYAREVCDFIAGMTDRFAILEYERLFDLSPKLG